RRPDPQPHRLLRGRRRGRIDGAFPARHGDGGGHFHAGLRLGADERPSGLPPMSDIDLDGDVRQSDPDRWLSSRFVVDPAARADLIALYAFEAELLAIPTRVTQPLMAEMRYGRRRGQEGGVVAGG